MSESQRQDLFQCSWKEGQVLYKSHQDYEVGTNQEIESHLKYEIEKKQRRDDKRINRNAARQRKDSDLEDTGTWVMAVNFVMIMILTPLLMGPVWKYDWVAVAFDNRWFPSIYQSMLLSTGCIVCIFSWSLDFLESNHQTLFLFFSLGRHDFLLLNCRTSFPFFPLGLVRFPSVESLKPVSFLLISTVVCRVEDGNLPPGQIHMFHLLVEKLVSLFLSHVVIDLCFSFTLFFYFNSDGCQI